MLHRPVAVVRCEANLVEGEAGYRGIAEGITNEGTEQMKVEGRIEFQVIEQTPERVISEMPVQPGIKNPYGGVHAGAMLWFADVTATVLAMGSSNFREGMPGFPLVITLNANFAGNQKEGRLKAVASFVKKGKTVSIVRTTVFGENDRLIADVTTTHVPAK